MEGVATSISVAPIPAFFSSSINSKPYLFLREHLHWPSSHFASHQVVHSQLLGSGAISDGSRKSQPFKRNYATDDRSSREDERRLPRGSSSGKWSSQKRLLTLFKQIETSISQEKSRSMKERESTVSPKDYHVSFDSVLEALEEPDRQEKDRILTEESDSISNHKKRAAKTENEVGSLNHEPSAKALRPPSSFIKKSPISSSSTRRIESIDLTAVKIPVEEEPLELGKMKLTELKEVAKARGIKGYSKLKKSELVDLLSTQDSM